MPHQSEDLQFEQCGNDLGGRRFLEGIYEEIKLDRRVRFQSSQQLSGYLLKRGLWLVLLEITVLRLAFTFNFFSGPILLTILWAIGWSMIALP